MSAPSQTRRNAVLRTYSRRVNNTFEAQTKKKRRVIQAEESSAPILIVETMQQPRKLEETNVDIGTKTHFSKSLSKHIEPENQDEGVDAFPHSSEGSHQPPLNTLSESHLGENDAKDTFLTTTSSNKKIPLQDISPANSQPPIFRAISCNKFHDDVDSHSSSEASLAMTWPGKATNCPASSSENATSPGKFSSQIQVENNQTKCSQTDCIEHQSSTSFEHSHRSSAQKVKKRRNEGLHEDSPIAAASAANHLPKKSKPSSIRNYFRPLPRSSSPQIPRFTPFSSDSIEPRDHVTPPSSPPSAEDSILVPFKEIRRKAPRRLTARPILEPLDDMSSRNPYPREDNGSFREIVGDGSDPSRIQYAEAYMDPEEREDLARSQMVSQGNRPRSDSYQRSFAQPIPHGHLGAGTGLASRQSNARPSSRYSSSEPSVNRAVSQPLMENGRGSRPARANLSSSSREVYSEPALGNLYDVARQRSTTFGNTNLYGNSEIDRLPPNMPISQQKPYLDGLAPYNPSHSLQIPKMASRKRDNSGGYQQLQIDLGKTRSITCPKCSMAYNPSLPMDARQHADFCRTAAMPALERRLLNNKERPVWEKIVHGVQHHIRVYGCTSSPAQRAHARQVLDATYEDLPGMKYTDIELSSEIPDPLGSRASVPRFKFYVYYQDTAVLGTLLVERFHAFDPHEVIRRGGNPWFREQIVLDRIWVSPEHRRQGYATQLVDTAREEFIGRGLVVDKEQVAMPEQTEMGRGFAERYFL